MNLNLLHLQYFYTVARENGFTKASKTLRIQQPAISRMVKLLEEDLEFKLFEKVGRNVQLTPQGIEVFEYCKKIFGTVEELRQSVGQINDECKGPLLLAASEPIASHFIPQIMSDYKAQYKKVYPNIFSGPASILFDKIIRGEIELGLFFHTPEIPEKLEIFKTLNVKFHLVIKKNLKRNKDVIESFIGSREIDDTSTSRFPTLDRLKRDYPEASIKISSNNLTAHREMVLRGLGVSILPDFLVKQDIQDGNLAALYPNENFNFQMKFIKRKTAIMSTNAKAWIQLIDSTVR
jgi:DNA-binding transcriptional LysR family regulator